MATCTARLLPSASYRGPELTCALEPGHYTGPAAGDDTGRVDGSWHCDTDPPGVGSRVWADTAEGAVPHLSASAYVPDGLLIGDELLDHRETRSSVWRIVYAAVGGHTDPSIDQARAVAEVLRTDGWTPPGAPTPLRDEGPSGSPAVPLRAYKVDDRVEVMLIASLGVILEEGEGPASGPQPATVLRVDEQGLEVELDAHGPAGSRVTIAYGIEPDGTFPALRPLERDGCGCEGAAHSCGNPGTTP